MVSLSSPLTPVEGSQLPQLQGAEEGHSELTEQVKNFGTVPECSSCFSQHERHRADRVHALSVYMCAREPIVSLMIGELGSLGVVFMAAFHMRHTSIQETKRAG